jgi:acetone carboxylase gamma subunit
MKVLMTEYLRIDLEKEQWECRVCNHVVGPANKSYKEGMLVHNRNPQEIHPPIIDPEKYRFTFSPDPDWVRILEFYCPSCGTMVENEYAIPGHPPLYDMEVDLPALKAQWATREEVPEPVVGPEVVRGAGHSNH